MTEKWIAMTCTAEDQNDALVHDLFSGAQQSYALGDTPEAAQTAWIEVNGNPEFGFYVIVTRKDYIEQNALFGKRTGAGIKAREYKWLNRWHIVARVSDDALRAIENGCDLLDLWLDVARTDGQFFISLTPAEQETEQPRDLASRINPSVIREVVSEARAYAREAIEEQRLAYISARDESQDCAHRISRVQTQDNSRAARTARMAMLDAIDGVDPSNRQREWAQRSPWNWIDEMAWAHNKKEIVLTQDEIAYVQMHCKAAGTVTVTGSAPITVNAVYRWK